MFNDAYSVFTSWQPEQIKYGPGKASDANNFQALSGVKNSRLIEQPHYKGRGQGLQSFAGRNAKIACKMKNNFRITIGHYFKTRLFHSIPPIVPKTLYGIA
jgi:hypothetical protein